MSETAKDLIYSKKTYVNYSGLELPEAGMYGETFAFPLLRIGTSTYKAKIGTADVPMVHLVNTCALTAGMVHAMDIDVTQTGVMVGTGYHEVLRVNLTSNVKTGAWANAIVGRIDYSTSGAAHGMAAAICAEMNPPNSSLSRGALYALDLEMGVAASASWASAGPVGMMNIGMWGDGVATFDSTGIFLHFEGYTAAAGKLVSLTTQTVKCHFGTTARYLLFSQLEDGVGLGVSATPMVMTAYTDRALAIYTTCSLASGDARSVTINGVRTGIGGVGQIVHVNLETNVALGAYATALYATVDCKTNGKATGLISAIAGDMTMPASNPGAGSFCIYEANFICPASWTGTNYMSIMNINASGATVATFDTAGLLFDITGVTIASGKFVQANTATAASHAIKCRINGTLYYVMLTNVGA